MSNDTVEVALALTFRKDRWLVTRRRADVHLPSVWEFPGGKRTPGESAEAAAVRELSEECGVVAEVVETLAPVTHRYPERVVELVPVICRWRSGTPRPIESDACRWVTIQELRELNFPAANNAILVALERFLQGAD